MTPYSERFELTKPFAQYLISGYWEGGTPPVAQAREIITGLQRDHGTGYWLYGDLLPSGKVEVFYYSGSEMRCDHETLYQQIINRKEV